MRSSFRQTLGALSEKVSPKQVMEQATAKLRDKVDDVADKVSPPRVARRQVDKLKDKLGSAPDEVAVVHVDDEARERTAEAARQTEVQKGPAR